MYLTEEEAKKKVCVYMYSTVISNIPHFQGSNITDEQVERHVNRVNCIASECMMFRHYGLPFTLKYYREQGVSPTEAEITESKKGYCGLGGKP